MKKYVSKIGALLAAALLVLGLSTPALADTPSVPDNESDRILNIYKYSPSTDAGDNGDGTEDTEADDGRIPLQNVEFEIYKVPSGQTTSQTPSAAEVTAIKAAGAPVTTMRTDADGFATYTFAEDNSQDGLYLVVEKTNPAVEAPADPFYDSIPLTNPNGNGWLYEVNVYPKNDVSDENPTVDKDVNELDNKSSSHAIGETQTWIIRGEVPADLYRAGTPSDVYAKNYSFTDILNTALTYQGNVAVKLLKTDGDEVPLDATHYTIGGNAAAGTAGGTLTVALTDAGKKYVMDNLGTDSGEPEIRVYFETVINDTAALATAIPNNVTLDYTNSANNQYDPETVPAADRPEVHTGGLLIEKVDKSSNAPLDGATFKIARAATQDEIDAGAAGIETITVGTDSVKVIFVEFYDTATMEGDKVTSVETVGGEAVINGLAYGQYYLIETIAPEDYNLLSGPLTVNVDATSHTNGITVTNSKEFELPVTGGAGIMMFTLGGVLFIGMAVILLVVTKKKKIAAE